MQQSDFKQFMHELLEQMGFRSFSVELDEEFRRGAVVIYEHEEMIKRNAPLLIEGFNGVFQALGRKHNTPMVFFDVNNYRKERERLLIELAKGAARKAVATKESVELPPMNSYERRLVHAEISMRPDVETESTGEGRDRHIVVKPIF